MGVDNVLAIGGAAHGSILLIVLGLAISVPIIVWGSQLVIRLVDRFPSVVLLGGAVLAWTAYSMIVREPLLVSWFEAHPATKLVAVILIFSISLAPWYTRAHGREDEAAGRPPAGRAGLDAGLRGRSQRLEGAGRLPAGHARPASTCSKPCAGWAGCRWSPAYLWLRERLERAASRRRG